MSKSYDQLTDAHVEFIRNQKIFFVATAPLSGEGSVNLSPKGYDSLSVVNANKIAWVDLGGSGIETLAHLKENGRITLMFCAFEGGANIMRVYGRGRALTFDDQGFDDLMARFPTFERARAVVEIDVTRVQDSCGWGVPFFDYKGERDQLRRYIDHRPLDEWKAHRYATNATSVDGLPGLTAGSTTRTKT